MGKGNTQQRKTSLARIVNLEEVVDGLLEHIETENLFDRLGKLETRHATYYTSIQALVESAQSHTAQLADLEAAGATARAKRTTLRYEIEYLQLWPWQRAGRRISECFKTWF